jgi:hypothetical protein
LGLNIDENKNEMKMQRVPKYLQANSNYDRGRGMKSL